MQGLRTLAAAALALILAACASPAYYFSLATGQRALLDARQPIKDILADPQRDAELKRRLALVQEVRRFASAVLGLPDNGSYTTYVELSRPYVVWNVYATPALSLEPRTWCHPFLGCLAYRGYFDAQAAASFAAELRADGDDVYVGGVPAYSSLGWFDDPVVSSMLHWDDDQLLGTIIHELAHQKLFVAGDTAFSESFASFVAAEGLQQFRSARGEPAPGGQAEQRRQQFVELVLRTRNELEVLYALPLPVTAMRAEKQRVFARLHERYAALKQARGGDGAYDAWFADELNNAKLLPIGLYHQWQPAFAVLFARSGGDWPAFHAQVAALARQEEDARTAQLRELLPEASRRQRLAQPLHD